jgi:hypothetical protein
MDMGQLEWACRLYGQLTNYDASLRELRSAVDGRLDPWRADHRARLLRWLNQWGCRQFALDYHEIASESLAAWADAWMADLPNAAVTLVDLTDGEVRTYAEAYADLARRTASYKRRAKRTSAVTFGPTGAAKTLFALRPEAVPPWDDPIRRRLGANGDLGSFRRYLLDVATQLRSLAAEARVPVSQLPALVGRPGSNPPKLIDEYNWVVITRGLPPPGVG